MGSPSITFPFGQRPDQFRVQIFRSTFFFNPLPTSFFSLRLKHLQLFFFYPSTHFSNSVIMRSFAILSALVLISVSQLTADVTAATSKPAGYGGGSPSSPTSGTPPDQSAGSPPTPGSVAATEGGGPAPASGG